MIKFCAFASFLVAFFAGLVSTPIIAANLAAGKARAEATCQTCHGMDGLGTIAGVPNLSGQREDYMIKQLKAFRSSQRQHPQMSIIAQMLSDEDIENVSKWYSSIKISVELPE
jgi:cytochrome c553